MTHTHARQTNAPQPMAAFQTPDPSSGDVEPRYTYPQGYLLDVLNRVRSIAIVGASANPTKFSYAVLSMLQDAGYDVLPVNPNPTLLEIRGNTVYHSLAEIDRPVDMVDVFRPRHEFYGIAQQAIAIGATVLWGQLDIYDDAAAKLAEEAGLTVVMDRCPKIELMRAL